MQATTYDLWLVYVKRWLREHCTKEDIAKARQVCREENRQARVSVPFLEWVAQWGINGMAPACYAEWLENEHAEGID